MKPVSNLVSTDWLRKHLGDPDVVVLDGSWALSGPDPKEVYRQMHIPGARFFDIDEACDRECPLPHMLPTPAAFGEYAGGLGISNDDMVVIYDTGGLFPAARVWWTFRAFGHDRVAVLDGGLRKWAREGKPVTAAPPNVRPKTYRAKPDPARVAGREDVLKNCETGQCLVLDARGPGRFSGTEPEPRPGMRSGHIPAARNLHYASLFHEDGTYLSPREVRALLESRKIDTDKPVITSCGSGVTAAILAFAIEEAGLGKAKLYDGSWAEWGSRQDTPVETGADPADA